MMDSTALPDFAALRKASRFAGLVTLAGACVVLASIGYSVWRLADTETKLAAERKEVTDLKGEVETLGKTKAELAEATAALSKTADDLKELKSKLNAEVRKSQQDVADALAQKRAIENEIKGIAATITQPKKNAPTVKPQPIEQIKDALAEREELERQIVVLRKEATFIRDELSLKFSDPLKNLELWNQGKLRWVMTLVLVSPTSKYDERNDTNSPTGKWYDFTLQVKFPENNDLAAAMKRDIKSVTYELNHPYRKIAPLVSTKSDDNFAVRYDGAGTLRNVVIKIDIEGAGIVALDYDMTKAHPNAKDK
jgi:hypothetical protein